MGSGADHNGYSVVIGPTSDLGLICDWWFNVAMGDLRFRERLLFGALLLVAGIGLSPPASASAVQIQAHRGGANAEGVGAYGEKSMGAFRLSAEAGYVLEMDLGQTSDGVPVAMHDDDLDRTTDCEGEVADRTWAELAPCRIDRIGIGDARVDLPPGDPRLEPVPSLAQIIDMLKETGATANIEVKNLLAKNLDFPHAVYQQLAASGLPPGQVIIQNFNPTSLTDAPAYFPGVATSMLSPNIANDIIAIEYASKGSATWVSPEWPISAEFLARAHTAGLKVVPWTVDEADQMIAAAGLGVDAIITNDPALADRLIGPKPALSLKAGPNVVKARPGKVARFRVQVRNAGDGPSGAVQVQARFRRSADSSIGSKKRAIAEVEPDGSVTVRFAFRVRRGAKPGSRSKVKFSLSGAEGVPKVVSRTVRVIRPRR